jgi:hypothetical protein
MAGESQENKVSLLMTRTLATTDALAKLLIAKGIITEEGFKRLSTERGNHLRVLNRMQL